MVLISFDILWYYVSIMGWIQYYFVFSFSSELPWSTCGNWWNTENCKEEAFLQRPTANLTKDKSSSLPVMLESVHNVTYESVVTSSVLDNVSEVANKFTSPANEFWLHNVLRKSGSLEDMGSVQWHLVLSNFIGWAIVVASLIKGVQSLGKVVYLTATAPYVLLTVLLIRGLMLDGAVDGIVWYITPDFEKLTSPQVWLQAAIQVFYSLGPTYGGVITMASHNKFHQKSILETTICVASDAFTAFYAGLVVFVCMGFMAKEAGVSVEEAAKSTGPGLAFVAYPEALSRMPLSQLWAALFFFMLITVALDSTGGIYLFQLSDWYISAFALLFGSALESIMVAWIYGADRFAQDIELMTGRKVSKVLRIFWCIGMAGFLSIAFFITVVTSAPPDYGDGYVYQPYAKAIGMLMSLIPFVPLVLVMVKDIVKAKGSLIQRTKTLLQPSAKWKPVDEQAQELYLQTPYRYENTLCKRIRANLLGDKDTPWF